MFFKQKAVVCRPTSLVSWTTYCMCSSLTPRDQAVVIMDGVSERDRAEAVRAGLRVYAFGEVEGIGASHLHAHPHRPPAATDLATFC